LIAIFAGGLIVDGVQRVDGAPPLDASIALKACKNGLDARKLREVEKTLEGPAFTNSDMKMFVMSTSTITEQVRK
jgi:hypothetical protein